jgi:acid phosphatase
VVTVLLALAACGAAGCASAGTTAPIAPIPGARVAVIVLENHGPGALLRRGWLARAALRGGRALAAVGERHPAQPYFVMLSGALRALSDAQAVAHPVSQANLTTQLDRRHVSWAAYMDSMPYPCYGRTSASPGSGLYVKRHDPFLFFTDVVDNPADCRSDVVPGRRLAATIAQRRLPRLSWITPNVCEDMHSCPVSAGERWLARTLPPLISALGPRGLVLVVADERSPAGRGGGRIPLVALGPQARPGSVLRRRVDHRALLATIEDVLGLGRLATTRHSPTLRALLR